MGRHTATSGGKTKRIAKVPVGRSTRAIRPSKHHIVLLLAATAVVIAILWQRRPQLLPQPAGDTSAPSGHENVVEPPVPVLPVPQAEPSAEELVAVGTMSLCAHMDPLLWHFSSSRYGLFTRLLWGGRPPVAHHGGDEGRADGDFVTGCASNALEGARVLLISAHGGATARMLAGLGAEVDVVRDVRSTVEESDGVHIRPWRQVVSRANRCYDAVVDRTGFLDALAGVPPASRTAATRTRPHAALLDATHPDVQHYSRDVRRRLCPDAVVLVPLWQCSAGGQDMAHVDVMAQVTPDTVAAVYGAAQGDADAQFRTLFAQPVHEMAYVPGVGGWLVALQRSSDAPGDEPGAAPSALAAVHPTPPVYARAARALRRDGHVLVRGVFGADEVAAVRHSVEAAMQQAQWQFGRSNLFAYADDPVEKGKSFVRVHNLAQVPPCLWLVALRMQG